MCWHAAPRSPLVTASRASSSPGQLRFTARTTAVPIVVFVEHIFVPATASPCVHSKVREGMGAGSVFGPGRGRHRWIQGKGCESAIDGETCWTLKICMITLVGTHVHNVMCTPGTYPFWSESAKQDDLVSLLLSQPR